MLLLLSGRPPKDETEDKLFVTDGLDGTTVTVTGPGYDVVGGADETGKEADDEFQKVALLGDAVTVTPEGPEDEELANRDVEGAMVLV